MVINLSNYLFFKKKEIMEAAISQMDFMLFSDDEQYQLDLNLSI